MIPWIGYGPTGTSDGPVGQTQANCSPGESCLIREPGSTARDFDDLKSGVNSDARRRINREELSFFFFFFFNFSYGEWASI